MRPAAAPPPDAPETGSSLNGAKKAALLLLAIGRPLAGQVLRHFTAEELRLIPRYASDTERISSTQFEKLVEEFGREFADGMNFTGSAREVEEMITGALTPEQIAQMNPSSIAVAAQHEPAWEKLSALPEQTLSQYISNEHPQIAAAILSRISPDTAAKTVAILEAAERRDIIGRMLSMKGPNEAVIGLIERAMAGDLLATGGGAVQSPAAEGRSRVASIINKLDETQAEEALSSLAELHPDEARALKGMLFSFSDLTRLSTAGRTALLDKIPTDRLVLALRGTDAAFQTIALGSLAARAKRMVEAELTSGQNPPQREVRAAQRAIADMALAMAARGEIELDPAPPPDAEAKV
ncbi:flagellar motor switch protein FliG [soil metagenome]